MKQTLHVILILSFFVATLIGCVNTKHNNTDQTPVIMNYIKVAEEKYGTQVECIESPGKKYVLCKSLASVSPKFPQGQLSFSVLNQEMEIVYEQVLDNGKVKWYAENKLEIINIPGIMAEGQTLENYTVIYDVETKEGKYKSEIKE